MGPALVAAALCAAVPARADVPGPRSVCDVEGMHCEDCWRSYNDSMDASAQFDACKAEKEKKGLREGCSHRQGAGDAVFFCPAGENPQIVTRGGCGGCSAGARPSGPAWLAALALIALAALRRR